MPQQHLFDVKDEVRAALADGRAVVALESTVISHGLPRPLNLETARALETAVREGGAVPATVAVIKGRLCVGLDEGQLERLAFGEGIRKVSRRDLAAVVARGEDGATTVAGTLWIASRAGLKVFATGGIGGVHRGPLPDVSADLPELARTPMTVVCSGAKSVLDLPATREWLETHGVTVVGYQCDELPAFYARTSGLPVDARADTPEEAARLAAARDALGLEQALIVAVPVPPEAAPDERRLEEVLNSALSEAERRGVSGRELTPFLLSRMADASGGATLRANAALLENNARVAARIAAALAARR
ncbi:MAG TPA: pseudouridine-5'-phosphate glycosidase [Pyrinomonadaceae bacterium]|jgi:pseudouridine-5'-phosphate glycosidase|nr:pseudouridine-5'-phosphate glycosidase [Pyrinomonadaceae bacterium]